MDESERPGERAPGGTRKWRPSPTSRRSSLPSRRFRTRTRQGFPSLERRSPVRAEVLVAPPDETREHQSDAGNARLGSTRFEARLGADRRRRERFLNRVLTLDDDVAEALYSPTRSVRTYSRSDVTPLRNNYNGATPTPAYLPGWNPDRLRPVLGARRTPRDRRHARRFAHHSRSPGCSASRGGAQSLGGRAALRESPAGLSPTAAARAGRARILGQPGTPSAVPIRITCRSTCDRSTPQTLLATQSVRKDAPGRTRRALRLLRR